MNSTVTPFLLEAIKRAVNDRLATSERLKSTSDYDDAGLVGATVRQAYEQAKQDCDVITGWLERETEDKDPTEF